MILIFLSDVSPARTPVFFTKTKKTAYPQNLKTGPQIHANYPSNNCAKKNFKFSMCPCWRHSANFLGYLPPN